MLARLTDGMSRFYAAGLRLLWCLVWKITRDLKVERLSRFLTTSWAKVHGIRYSFSETSIRF